MLVRTASVDDTRALAVALADLLRPGDVVLLSGEMGAGKTAFTQGLGAGLGISERITSPTFTIAHTYEGGRLRLHHLDVYRLEHLHEALDIGLAEMVDDGAVVVIEWGDAVVGVLPADYLELRITFPPRPGTDADAFSSPDAVEAHAVDGDGDGDVDPLADERRGHLRPVGARWAARADGLRSTLARWADESC